MGRTRFLKGSLGLYSGCPAVIHPLTFGQSTLYNHTRGRLSGSPAEQLSMTPTNKRRGDQWGIKASLEMSLAGGRKKPKKQTKKGLAFPKIPPKEIERTLSGRTLESTFRHCLVHARSQKVLLGTNRKLNLNSKSIDSHNFKKDESR